MDEKQLLQGRFRDLSDRAFRQGYMTHTAFLSASEQAVFYDYVRTREGHPDSPRLGGAEYLLYGGREDADRRAAVFLPAWMDREGFMETEAADPQVAACLRITPLNARFADELTHRDFLGALMHLGIERDQIGDILTGPAEAYVYVMKEIAPFIREELCRVRHTSVMAAECLPGACTLQPRLEDRTGSVASERIDAVIAMVWKMARGTARDLVLAEAVTVTGRLVLSPADPLREGDRVSVRGRGKFIYRGTGGKTRKGRLFAAVQVYC